MAEAFGSAIAGETVNRVTTYLINKHDEKVSKRHNIERVEMAYNDMEHALEKSKKFTITDVPLLRRRRMLKRAFVECGDVLQRCKQRALEDEETQQGVARSYFPTRIFHATKSFIRTFTSPKKDELSNADVGRYEYFADRASKFLTDVESNGTLWHYNFFNPLIGRLLAGEILWYFTTQGSQKIRFLIWPVSLEDRGVEAWLSFFYEDSKKPEKNIVLALMLRLSESTNIIEIFIKCVQLITTNIKFVVEPARDEITQLPTQDMRRACFSPRYMEEWYNSYMKLTHFLRPDPLCCKAHRHTPCINKTNSSEFGIFPEQVIGFVIKHSVSALQYNLFSSTLSDDDKKCVKYLLPLQIEVYVTPHVRYERIQKSSILSVNGKIAYTAFSLHQVDETLLAMAKDYFNRQAELMEYSMVGASAHGYVSCAVTKTSSGRSKLVRRGKVSKRR